MSISDELRADLIAFLRGGLDEDEARRMEQRLASDAELRRELDVLRDVLATVAAEVEITPTPEETRALSVAVDDALRGARIVPHPAWRRAFDAAVHRYATSARFRRTTLASIGVHAAAAAVIAWIMLSPDGPVRRQVEIATEYAGALPQLDETAPPLHDPLVDVARAPREFDGPLESRPFVESPPDGVVVPPVLIPGGMTARGDQRFPTLRIAAQLVLDRDQAVERLRDRLFDLADEAEASVSNGLRFLAGRRADDGRWGPVPQGAEPDFRDGVTAAVVLAHVQSGHGAAVGDGAELLAPAVASLERRLRDGPDAADPKPVYSQALALRALTWQWALDFRHLGPAARAARFDLLRTAGEALIAQQSPSGGFTYHPADDTPDASCTLFATAALADLRMAGVLRPDAALARAAAYVSSLRDTSGAQGYAARGDRAGDLALTASALAYAPELGITDGVEQALDVVAGALVRGSDLPDALLDWGGMTALLRHDRDIAPAMRALLRRQRADGGFTASTDRHCRLGGDDLTTALGVLSVSRAMLP